MTRISRILGHTADHAKFSSDALATRQDFQNEYVSPNGRLVSDSQTAYALAICFKLLTVTQAVVAGTRLAYLVHKNGFRIGTGFAGTPFVCEALVRTGHANIAYAMLTEKTCPSWLYPATMGGTTMWERWDSMLPDGSVNPGEMTSFNHYAFGTIATFLHERVAGLQRLTPGWTKCRFAPLIGADFQGASVEHVTPFGRVKCEWEIKQDGDGVNTIRMQVSVPYGVTLEVEVPQEDGEKTETVEMGLWVFESKVSRDYEWPIKPLPPKS
jgi:alpha-L-rhamnosidase